MAYTKICAFFLLMMAFLRASIAGTYEVGDAAGWTNEGVDYKSWASKQKFSVGDSIVFKYNPQANNVVQVSKEGYKKCSTGAQLAAYTSGNDEIQLTNPGKYYFICSFPGTCEKGQKVEIKVSSSKNKKQRDTPDNDTPASGNSSNPCGFKSASSSALSFYDHLWFLILASCVLSLYLH